MQEVSGMQILPKPMLSWKVKFIKRFTLLFTCYVKLLNSWAAFDNYIWVNGIILGSLVYWIWHFYKCWSSGTQTDMSNKFCYHLVDSLGIAIAPDVRLAVWCQLSGPQWFSHYEVLCFNLSKEKFYVLNYEKWKKVHIGNHIKHERAMFARDTLNCGNLLMGWFQWSIRSLVLPYWQHLIFPAFWNQTLVLDGCIKIIELIAMFPLFQVPPDFYIPDFDEDEQNPDERMDRK